MQKYRITEILSTMLYQDRIKATSELKDKLGLTTVQFSRRIRVKVTDTLDFKGTELPTIANVLKVRIEDLFTKVASEN